MPPLWHTGNERPVGNRVNFVFGMFAIRDNVVHTLKIWRNIEGEVQKRIGAKEKKSADSSLRAD